MKKQDNNNTKKTIKPSDLKKLGVTAINRVKQVEC